MIIEEFLGPRLKVESVDNNDYERYPTMGECFWIVKIRDGRYYMIAEDETSVPGRFPNYWERTPMELLEPDDTTDPSDNEVPRTERRLYGIIKFKSHYYHVWFFVKARSAAAQNGDLHFLRCIARSIPRSSGEPIYPGGYNNGRD